VTAPIRRLAAVASVLALAACAGEDGTTLGRFSVTEDLAEARVEGSALAALPAGAILPFDLDVRGGQGFPSEDEFDFLTRIEITDITLTIAPSSEDPEDDALENGLPDDFEFLDAIALSIEAEIDGERRSVDIASVPEGDARLARGSRSVTLSTTGENLLPFVEAPGGYRLVADASGTPPPDDVVFDGSVRYRLSVGFR